MQLSHALRQAISRLLIGVLLVAQLAVAAYACPSLASMQVPMLMGGAAIASDDASLVQASAAMTDCEQMHALDNQSPNLCLEHCRHGQQSAETASMPTVFVALPVFLYPLPIESPAGHGSDWPALCPDVSRTAATPPHSILYCVFRI